MFFMNKKWCWQQMRHRIQLKQHIWKLFGKHPTSNKIKYEKLFNQKNILDWWCANACKEYDYIIPRIIEGKTGNASVLILGGHLNFDAFSACGGNQRGFTSNTFFNTVHNWLAAFITGWLLCKLIFLTFLRLNYCALLKLK